MLNDAAMAAGFAALRPGITEREIATVIRKFYKANGATPEFTSVCFGPNGAFPITTPAPPTQAQRCRADRHRRPHRRLPQRHDPRRLSGQCARQLRRNSRYPRSGSHRCIECRQTRRTSQRRRQAARDVITAAGYGPNFVHRTGHGLGIDIHETPYITATSGTVLEEGMVFSIEPGIYLKGQFGLRLEEIVIIRNGAAEIFSDMPRTPVAGGV